MLWWLKLALAATTGIVLGMATTYLAASGQPWFGAAKVGPWTAWPTAGTADQDPYSRAVFATDGRVALAASEGLRFQATHDSAGQRLDGHCDYLVGGATPQAQFWTLTRLDPDGFVTGAPEARHGFTSGEVLRGPDGNFTLTLSRTVSAGNWLALAGPGSFGLMLSFYDTPLTTALQTGGSAPALPTIVRTTCR